MDLFFIYIGVNKAGHGAFKSKKVPQIPVKFNMAHSLFIKWLFLLQNIIDIVILWAFHVYDWYVQLYLVNTAEINKTGRRFFNQYVHSKEYATVYMGELILFS